MTVSEFISTNKVSKLWLCPNRVSSGKLSIDPLLQGYECTSTTVPIELRDKEIDKHFIENKTECIIWHNEDEV